MSALKAIVLLAGLLLAPHARADQTVVEYFHSGFGHYFITANPGEITALDARQPPLEQWTRTGFTFRAVDAATAPGGTVPICRFFNASFAPKSSHFYAPKGLGCETTIAQFPDWLLEDDKAFAAWLPDAAGACPAGTVPIFRLYNNGNGGAPNHRFVASIVERQAMLDTGFVAEGTGIGVGMCGPSPAGGRTTAEGYWRGPSNQGQTLRTLVLGDLSYYVLYTPTGSEWPAGVVYGEGIYDAGTFRSTSTLEVSFTDVAFPGSAAILTATYVPGSSLSLTNGTTSGIAAYDDSYDGPASLASLAGIYRGVSGHRSDAHVSKSIEIGSAGLFGITGVECDFAGTLTPRGTTGLFDVTIVSSRGPCFGGPGNGGAGVLVYEKASKTFHILVPLSNDLFFVFGTKD